MMPPAHRECLPIDGEAGGGMEDAGAVLAAAEAHEEVEWRRSNLHLDVAAVHTAQLHHSTHDHLWRHRWSATSDRGHQCAPAPLLLQLDHAGSARQHTVTAIRVFKLTPHPTLGKFLQWANLCVKDEWLGEAFYSLPTSCPLLRRVPFLAKSPSPRAVLGEPTIWSGFLPAFEESLPNTL